MRAIKFKKKTSAVATALLATTIVPNTTRIMTRHRRHWRTSGGQLTLRNSVKSMEKYI